MTENFQANGRPILIGSLPLTDHAQASHLVFKYTPQIPIWVQLPRFEPEGMLNQFMPGLPGVRHADDRYWVDTAAGDYDDQLLQFYEEYMAVTEGGADADGSRFALQMDTAPGFFVLLERLEHLALPPTAVKGQITGPITFTTAIKDQNKTAIFYDAQLRDAAVKLLALKARWQVRRLSACGAPVIVFLDEPAMAGVGSSEFTSISDEDITACLAEVIAAVHAEGGLAGVHVCANTAWPLVLESGADIASFDAYSYFDRLMLFPAQLLEFVKSGGILAWGIVPTFNAGDIERETADSLAARLEDSVARVAALGIDAASLQRQCLISPGCGTGALRPELSVRVLKLTRDVSRIFRSAWNRRI